MTNPACLRAYIISSSCCRALAGIVEVGLRDFDREQVISLAWRQDVYPYTETKVASSLAIGVFTRYHVLIHERPYVDFGYCFSLIPSLVLSSKQSRAAGDVNLP